MVNNIGQSLQNVSTNNQNAGNQFNAVIGQVKTDSTGGSSSIDKQMTWLDLNTDQELASDGHHCVKATGKGGCGGAKKRAKLPKEKKSSIIKHKIMRFLKKVKRWNKRRKKKNKKHIPSGGKQNSKSDNQGIPL